MRNIRQAELNGPKLLFDFRKARVQALDLVAHALHRLDLRRGVLLVLLERRDFLRSDVALILQRFDIGDRPPPLRVELDEAFQIDFRIAVLQRDAILVSMFAEVFARQHGARIITISVALPACAPVAVAAEARR